MGRICKLPMVKQNETEPNKTGRREKQKHSGVRRAAGRWVGVDLGEERWVGELAGLFPAHTGEGLQAGLEHGKIGGP